MADAGAISVEQLVKLSGLTDRRLRELSAEGWFPKPVNGQYQLVPTIQGLLRYYREGERSRVMLDAYDSIGACAAATGIPISTIKHAKRQGCSAFRGSRVYLGALLRWMFESPERSLVNYDQERAQHIILQNAKLKVELRNLKRELIPVEEVTHLGAELGAAIRKVVTRIHRTAPSLEGQPVPVIESRLKEEEDDILKQLHTLDERLSQWREVQGP
ncbi:MAG TPA: hypothetical protein PKM73_07295 [Verrucomicrobiota bacterium]|nr:hypothetical protein [Verrucomicrobiota bacterium]HNU50168.1 hypothetical protein [Verrucomicrobiota bacterium]